MLPSTTTLTILPTHLRLLRIPLPLKNALLHPLLDLWWFRRAGDPFFALCANGVEVSVFAEARAVDRGGWGRMGGGGEKKAEGEKEGGMGKGKGKGRAVDDDDGVVVSPDLWVALEIAFGGNGWEQAGSRVHSLSSPLAARGVSILFLSTFYSDYILVRASSLPLVTSILEEEGFAFAEPVDEREEREVEEFLGGDGEGSEEDDAEGRTSGVSTRRGSRDDGGGGLASMTSSLVLSDEPLPGGGGGRSSSPHAYRSSSTSSHQSRSQSRSHSRTTTPGVSRSNSLNLHLSSSPSHSRSPSSTRTTTATPPAPSPAPSPGAGPSLSLLPDELICVGLSCATASHTSLWRQKVVEALFFPERLLPRPHTASSASNTSSAAASASTSTSSSSAQTATHPTHLQPPPTPFLALTQTADSASLTADVRLLRALFSPSSGNGSNPDSGSGLGAGEGHGEGEGGLLEGMVFAVGEGGVRGVWEGEEGVGSGFGSPGEEESASETEEEEEGGGESDGGFSFRESESSSSGGESDTGEGGAGAARGWGGDQRRAPHGSIEEGEQGDDPPPPPPPPNERTLLKCLQLDLVRFGLDKPGLVEHYASLLISSGITSLMYQSTFGSANILVAKRDVGRAVEVVERG
ncbi:hypothetical protein JCM6882_004389 [Rhodosporidiobolus microsporus]